MPKYNLNPEDFRAAEERTKAAIKREVEYALEALRDFKVNKGANVSAFTEIGVLLSYLPSTDVNPEDFGLTTDELPDLINRYHAAIEDAP